MSQRKSLAATGNDEKQAHNFNQADRERFLIAMIRTNFLKRLESSAHSLTLTLDRTIGKIDELYWNRIARFSRIGLMQPIDDLPDGLPDDDEEDEEFLINRARHPYQSCRP